MVEDHNRAIRLLSMFERLWRGDLINKRQEAERFGVDRKTIQRDMGELRHFLGSELRHLPPETISYCSKQKGYVMVRAASSAFSDQEVLVLAKILLESRAFPKREMNNILKKLVQLGTSGNRKLIKHILRNEQYHYMPVSHGQPMFRKIWDFSKAISEQFMVRIRYE